MHTLERKHNSGHVTYKIYPKEEADQEGIDYVYWKEAQVGDYAITDDDWVMKCYQRYDYDSGSQVILAGGRAWVNDRSDIIYEDYRKVDNYSTNKPQTWDEREANRPRTDRAIRVLAASLIATGKYDWEAAGEAYRPDQEVPKATLKRLMRKDSVKMKLNEELIKIYEEKNFTKSSVIDDLMEARQLAKSKEDLSNLNRAIETSIKLLAMEPKKTQRVDELEMDFSKEISDGIQKEKGRLTARRTTEGEDEQEIEQIPESNDNQE